MSTVTSAPAAPAALAQERARPPASIVPLRRLPVVAAALVFVVVPIAGNWLWALDART